MATKLICLSDGTLVEAEVDETEARPISGGAADRVSAALDNVEPILVNVCRPVAQAWSQIPDELSVEAVEIELGLAFEGEGNVFVAKAKAGANLTVRLTLKRRTDRVGDDRTIGR
jgi:hypothetical protein